jgi:hypothetical protein
VFSRSWCPMKQEKTLFWYFRNRDCPSQLIDRGKSGFVTEPVVSLLVRRP